VYPQGKINFNICFDFSSKWKGSHGMPEVFTIIFFVAWLHVRKIASRVKALSNCFHSLIIYQDLHFFLIPMKLLKQTKKLLAGFSAATRFSLSEIYWRKDVISSPL
jgi:hypothetical protein